MKALFAWVLAFIFTVLACMYAIQLCAMLEDAVPEFKIRRRIYATRAGKNAADVEAKLRAIFNNKSVA